MVNFIIIGPFMAICYRDIFKGLKDGTIYLGFEKRGMEFINSEIQINSCWFNSLMSGKNNEYIPLVKRYKDGSYKTLDNYDAINVVNVEDIPIDYDGEMCLPLTFFDRWNSDQFELIGMLTDKTGDGKYMINGIRTYVDDKHRKRKSAVLDGKMLFDRLLIRRKNT